MSIDEALHCQAAQPGIKGDRFAGQILRQATRGVEERVLYDVGGINAGADGWIESDVDQVVADLLAGWAKEAIESGQPGVS